MKEERKIITVTRDYKGYYFSEFAYLDEVVSAVEMEAFLKRKIQNSCDLIDQINAMPQY